MTMVRAASVILALLSLVAIGPRPADAETYRPWCVGYTATITQSCTFTSYEQCMQTARGGGGECSQNPWYLQYGEGRPALAAKTKSERGKAR
jgi:hypothetical protein